MILVGIGGYKRRVWDSHWALAKFKRKSTVSLFFIDFKIRWQPKHPINQWKNRCKIRRKKMRCKNRKANLICQLVM